MKNALLSFWFLHENICCGYSLEASHWDTHNVSFHREIRKISILDTPLLWSYTQDYLSDYMKFHFDISEYFDISFWLLSFWHFNLTFQIILTFHFLIFCCHLRLFWHLFWHLSLFDISFWHLGLFDISIWRFILFWHFIDIWVFEIHLTFQII